jgi:hypothetical protein
MRHCVCGSAAVCSSAATMCGSVRQCERQCAVVRAVVRTARSARGSVRQCAVVVIIIVIMQPPRFATNSCYNNTAAPERVIYASAGGLRTGHVRICGWCTDGSSTDLQVGGPNARIYGWASGHLRVIPAAAMDYKLGS